MIDPIDRWWHKGNCFVQQTHDGGLAGVIQTPTGTFAFSAKEARHWRDDDAVVGPFPPYLEGVGIQGDLSLPGILTAQYVLQTTVGADISTARWLVGGQEMSTGMTLTTLPEDGGKTITLEVTPRIDVSDTAGRPVTVDAVLAWAPPAPPDPGEPAEWRVPTEWPAGIPAERPRGPGPLRGPHPAAGSYLNAAPDAQRQAHIASAAAWDPSGPIDQNTPGKAMDLVLAFLWSTMTAGDLRAKAEAFLSRAGTPAARGQWWWLASSVLADHMWGYLDPTIRRAAQVVIGMELDAHRTGEKAGQGWGDLVWEGWPQSAGPQGFAWALIVWHEQGDPDWDILLDWFGRKFYLQYAPWHWALAAGEGDRANWPSQTYWQANVGAYLYHLHLAMSVATGIDHFTVRENGGWYAAMQGMIRGRRLPNGTDLGVNAQASWFYQPSYRLWSHGFPHAAALAFQTKDPVGLWEAWADGYRNPTEIVSKPWSAFLDPAAPREPVGASALQRRSQGLLVARTGWTEDDAVCWWSRGQSAGHHLLPTPGDFGLYHRGRLAGPAVTYGYGSDSEVWHRSLGLHTNGLLFFHPGDTSESASRPLYTAPGVQQTLSAMRDGSANWSQNPWGYRVSQTAPFLPDAWQDYQHRQAEFALSRTLDYREETDHIAEVIDWSPAFRSFTPTGLLYRPDVNNKPDRVEEGGWIRAYVWLRGARALVLIDRVLPVPGVEHAWQVHLNAEPVAGSPGLWAARNARLVRSLEGGWPHAAPPASRRQGNSYQCDGYLWLQQWIGGAPTDSVEIEGGPGAPFMVRTDAGWQQLTGIRQWPYPGVTVHMPESGPDELATWVFLTTPRQGATEYVTVLSTNPEPVSASLIPGGVMVGGQTVTLGQDGRVTVG